MEINCSGILKNGKGCNKGVRIYGGYFTEFFYDGMWRKGNVIIDCKYQSISEIDNDTLKVTATNENLIYEYDVTGVIEDFLLKKLEEEKFEAELDKELLKNKGEN